MTNAEKFCKLNGIEWNAREGHFNDFVGNPKFTDAKSILEVMMKREDWLNFAGSIGGYNPSRSVKIDLYYILNPDKLLDEAVKWCEKDLLQHP